MEGFPFGSELKNLPANAGNNTSSIRGLGWPLGKELATNSSILAWEISLIEETDRLSPCSYKKVRHDLMMKQQQQIYDKTTRIDNMEMKISLVICIGKLSNCTQKN